MQQLLKLLGYTVTDKVTGFVGVVTHVGVDLYGCLQAIVQPGVVSKENGEQQIADSKWFDVARLVPTGTEPVMAPVPIKGDLVVAGADLDKPVK